MLKIAFSDFAATGGMVYLQYMYFLFIEWNNSKQ